MSFQNRRSMTVMAGALALGEAQLVDWGDACHDFSGDVHRYPPRRADPKPESVLRHVAIAKAKKRRAAKQARRQRRNRK